MHGIGMNKFFTRNKSRKRCQKKNNHEKHKEKPLVIRDSSPETVQSKRHRRFIDVDKTDERDKGKSKVIDETAVEEEDEEQGYYVLHLFLKKATNVDPLSGAFFPFNGRDEAAYIAFVNDGHHKSYSSRTFVEPFVYGSPLPHPSWDKHCKFYFDDYPYNETLYLEIVEEHCWGDEIGPSNGCKVVGRAKIKMPKRLGEIEQRREPLVREVEEGINIGGLVEYNLKLSKEQSKFWWQL